MTSARTRLASEHDKPAEPRLKLLSHDVPAREWRDRLELLEALISAPNFDPALRGDVLRLPRDHPHLGWGCQVPQCGRTKNESSLLCNRHYEEWRQAKAAGISKPQFLLEATPAPVAVGQQRQRCLICPDRGTIRQEPPLCGSHYSKWVDADMPPLEDWCMTQRPGAGYGTCKVVICEEPAASPLGLCYRHYGRYMESNRPGGARLTRSWAIDYARTGRPPVVCFDDESQFQRWCEKSRPVLVTGCISLEGLPKLAAAELQWGLFDHYQQAQPSRWTIGSIQRTVRACMNLGIKSFAEREHPKVASLPSHQRMIIREIRESLRKIYFTQDDTKEVGFIETVHFGRQFQGASSYMDLTSIPQRWLRDLLWEYMAAQLRSQKCPRTRGPFDTARRSVIQLGTFLAAEVPQADSGPEVLTEKHTEAFVADMRHREREGLPSLGLFQSATGKATIVTSTQRRMTFNGLHKLLYWALETGQSEAIGLPRIFITAMPTGGTDPKISRNPFTDDVARALADEENLQQFAFRFDSQDFGLRDIWETIVFTGRRCSEVVKLRLDCIGRYGGLPLLWHDQTKVRNYNDAIRIPEYLFEKLEQRQTKTLQRFEEHHGRMPTRDERTKLALFPSPVCNANRQKSLSYGHFQISFSGWVDTLDLGAVVAHQARHTMATKLLRQGASLAHIRRYLGQVSDRMAEHYAKVANSDLEDVLQAVWVAGPGSSSPGELLTGDQPLTQHEAMALALDLSRRSTPAEGGLCTFQPVVDGGACPWNLDCENCDKFVLSGADLVYWRRKQQQWRSIAERAPDDTTADYLHKLFEPTARAIDGLERALAGMGLLEEALTLDLRRPQDYFQRVWSTAFRAADLARLADEPEPANEPEISGAA